MEQNWNDFWELKFPSDTPVARHLCCHCLCVGVKLYQLENSLLQSEATESQSPWRSSGEDFAQICEMHLRPRWHTGKVPPECHIVECVHSGACLALFTCEVSKDGPYFSNPSTRGMWDKGIWNPFPSHCTLGSSWLTSWYLQILKSLSNLSTWEPCWSIFLFVLSQWIWDLLVLAQKICMSTS